MPQGHHVRCRSGFLALSMPCQHYLGCHVGIPLRGLATRPTQLEDCATQDTTLDELINEVPSLQQMRNQRNLRIVLSICKDEGKFIGVLIVKKCQVVVYGCKLSSKYILQSWLAFRNGNIFGFFLNTCRGLKVPNAIGYFLLQD